MQFSEEEIYQSLDSAQRALLDTVFTAEEKATYLQAVKMNMVIIEYLEVNGDSLKITLSKEDARSMGIPEEYYDEVCMEMKDANSSPLPEVAQKIQTAKKNMAALKARIEGARHN